MEIIKRVYFFLMEGFNFWRFGEKQALRHYAKTLERDPLYFDHYWENSKMQVVAFGCDWEIAGETEDDIWNNKLSFYQKWQQFVWVHPPTPDNDEDLFAIS